jgi:hypothetical protein
MRSAQELSALALGLTLLSACGLFDTNVEPCGTHCPGSEAGNAGTSEPAGSGGSTKPDSGMDAQVPAGGHGGSDAGAGSGGIGGMSEAGTSVGGTGGSEAGGSGGSSGSAGSTAGPCASCPSSLPHCSNDECVECLEDGECSPGVCVDNACVDCRELADCKEATASRCSQRQCLPCTTKGDCTHLTDSPVCLNGTCVECDASDYAHCGTENSGKRRVCDVLAHTCSTSLEHSATLCEPCVSDAQCQNGQLCVMQTYDDPTDSPDKGEVEVGYYCFGTIESAPSQNCANTRPFVRPIAQATSIGGTTGPICGLRVTTCPAYKQYSDKGCSGIDDDETCGDARFSADAYCRPFASEFRCTTPCAGGDDCAMGVSCQTDLPRACSL